LRYALLAASGGLLLALPAGNANARVQVLVGFNCVQVPSNYTIKTGRGRFGAGGGPGFHRQPPQE